MIIDDGIKPNYVQILYYTLRQCRPNYNANEYKWKIGAAVMYKLDSFYKAGIAHQIIFNREEKPTLYGIEVEVDYENPDNLQLFEDITNKIAVKKSPEEEGE